MFLSHLRVQRNENNLRRLARAGDWKGDALFMAKIFGVVVCIWGAMALAAGFALDMTPTEILLGCLAIAAVVGFAAHAVGRQTGKREIVHRLARQGKIGEGVNVDRELTL